MVGQIQAAAGAVHRVVDGGKGLHPALEGLQLRTGGQGAGVGLQGPGPVPGGHRVQPGALHLPQLVGLVRRVVAGQQVLHLLHLGPEVLQGLAAPGGGGGQVLHLFQGGADGALLLLHLGQEAGLVVAAGVELAAQLVRRAGEGGVLLAGSYQRSDALLQGLALLHRQAGLADVGAALEYVLGHAQEGFAAGGGGEVRYRLGGAGINGGKGSHRGVGPGGAAEEGDVPQIGGGLQHALHGAAAPGKVAALVRVGTAVPGIQAVEHHPEEGCPGGFARLVGGFDEVEAGRQLQLLLLQLAEGGGKTFDLHALLLFLLYNVRTICCGRMFLVYYITNEGKCLC